MIRFLKHKEIDKNKWDRCIQRSPEATIFVCSFYLDAVFDQWGALILNDYEAVFPMAAASKYKINYLFQPFFTRYFGVYSDVESSEKLIQKFVAAIPAEFKFIEFCLPEGQTLNDKDFKIKERKYQFLDLSLPYEELKKGYSDNARRSIKKALKAEACIRKDITAAEVVDLFKKTKGQELEVFKAADYRNLNRLMEACVSKGQAEITGIFNKDGILCAAGFFMRYRDRYIFLKSGVSEYGKSHGFMHLLFDNFIRSNAETAVMLDFGGSSVESVARFYKNFGAKDCVYLQVQKNNLPKLVNWIKSLKR
jgi:hypothetical protein